jgi:hypothetical protein
MTSEENQAALQEVHDFAVSKGLSVRFWDPQKRALVIAWQEGEAVSPGAPSSDPVIAPTAGD